MSLMTIETSDNEGVQDMWQEVLWHCGLLLLMSWQGSLSSLFNPKIGVRSQQGSCPETLGVVGQDEISPVQGKATALAVGSNGL